jgi:3-hydroxyacyl-CoA dehydrogenase
VSHLIIRRVAVLGAGVMGAQIAAHCVNANIAVVLFDLPSQEGRRSGIAAAAVERLKKLSPAPLVSSEDSIHIEPANYEDDLGRLGECDLVIEAIAERMDWKRELYRKVAPHLAGHAIFASNTSGLSIEELANGLAPELR